MDKLIKQYLDAAELEILRRIINEYDDSEIFSYKQLMEIITSSVSDVKSSIRSGIEVIK